METQVGTNEVVGEINATGTIDTSNLKTGKARKQIDDESFLNAWLTAAGEKLTLSQFVTKFSAAGGYNPKSVEQKYYKWRKDLTKSLESQTDLVKKTNTENFLKISAFADGRIGVKRTGAGRHKIDRADQLSKSLTLKELMAKMGDVSEHVEGATPTVERKDGDTIIKAGQFSITVHQEPMKVGV